MSLRSKVIATIAVAATSIAGSAVIASPAMAAQSDCTPYQGTVCLTDTSSWGGQVWRQTTSQVASCRNLAREGFDNKASLAFNNTFGDGVLFIYDTNNCTGRSIGIGSQVGTKFTGTDAWLNNKAGSVKFVFV
ncbi:hypothetical protein [Actinoplanes sp. NPDC049681]|uniref:hypothetical protein n=1 Tax=Actinoplanes sp. NPDC049681 TaxID=3363905 RepID=UPI0037AF789D